MMNTLLAIAFSLLASTYSLEVIKDYDDYDWYGEYHYVGYLATAFETKTEAFVKWTWTNIDGDGTVSNEMEDVFNPMPLPTQSFCPLYRKTYRDSPALNHDFANLQPHFRTRRPSVITFTTDSGIGRPLGTTSPKSRKKRGYYGDRVISQISAIPFAGCKFYGWSGGSWPIVDEKSMVSAQYVDIKWHEYDITANATAIFAWREPGDYPWGDSTHAHKSTTSPDDPDASFIVVSTFCEPMDGGSAIPDNEGYTGKYGQTEIVNISATPSNGFKFNYWIDEDGNVLTARTITKTYNYPETGKTDLHYLTAYFTSNGCNRVITIASPPEGGFTTGDGVYELNEGATIQAAPESGYRFLYWKDSSGNKVKQNPTEIPTIQSWVWTAYFQKIGSILFRMSDGKILHGKSGSILYAD